MVGFKHEGSSRGVDDEAFSKSSMEDGLECPVCWEGFNSNSHLPYVLWCGHSLCKSCLLGLQWATVKLPVVPVQLPLFICCPWCQFLSCRLVWEGRLKYPCKNFFLLWLVDSLRSDGAKAEAKSADPPEPSSILADQASASRLWEISSGTQQPSDVLFLQRWCKKLAGLCAHLVAKFMLLLLVLFILFCVLPFSMIVLMVYFVATLIFAFPSFLVVYFAFPSLSWLLREIVT
eukprot:c5070_g1_i2 orf=106-801(-)